MNALSNSVLPLRARVRKSNSAIGLVLFLAMGIVLAWITIRPPSPQTPLWMLGVTGAFTLLSLWGAYRFGERWNNLPLLLEAGQEGITTFQKRNAYDKDESGVLVLWSAIAKIETQVLRVPTGDGDSHFRCVVLHLCEGHELSLNQISLGMPNTMSIKLGRVAPDAYDNMLYLDGDSDYGSCEALADELNRRRQNSTR